MKNKLISIDTEQCTQNLQKINLAIFEAENEAHKLIEDYNLGLSKHIQEKEKEAESDYISDNNKSGLLEED